MFETRIWLGNAAFLKFTATKSWELGQLKAPKIVQYERQMNVSKLVLNPELVDLDDAPELTDEWFDKATFKVAGKVVRRGRPKGSNKEQVALRLDRDIIQHFKEGGAGWQSRINAALKELIR